MLLRQVGWPATSLSIPVLFGQTFLPLPAPGNRDGLLKEHCHLKYFDNYSHIYKVAIVADAGPCEACANRRLRCGGDEAVNGATQTPSSL